VQCREIPGLSVQSSKGAAATVLKIRLDTFT